MSVPISQMWTVARYVIGQQLRRRAHFPLVLMLEPLFRCNLACSGCGKIQHPASILKQHLSPRSCFDAVEECGAPIVSLPGGEPLLHPQIVEIVEGLVARRKYVYLCTNALLLKQFLPRFTPSKYLTFSVHLDGPPAEHDAAVSREGVFEIAVDALQHAIEEGFRVTTNTTLFNTADANSYRRFFDRLMEMGVEGLTVSPGYPYAKAPEQEHFLHRTQTVKLFRELLDNRPRHWRFNQSPLFLEFLRGHWHLPCTPSGNPTYNLLGWQKPCYLLQDGSVDTFAELLDETEWSEYGPDSGNPHCSDCMVHSGFEPTAIRQTFGSWKGLLMTVRLMLFGPPRRSSAANPREPGAQHSQPETVAPNPAEQRAA
ncbi:MAG: adenosyl-hopene transferase HpnH [Planctomycetaceae bacterium]|nr:adenosyl-hopene transferase HpnH [Planctomycetaceae bacterium]